jgi:hypothetical protein
MAKPRKVPRPFEMHWGRGEIVEEASYLSEHHEPTIQLMQYTEGEAAGSYSIRFCFYNPKGAFQRSPMMIGDDEIEGLRTALRERPRLRDMLRRLLD